MSPILAAFAWVLPRNQNKGVRDEATWACLLSGHLFGRVRPSPSLNMIRQVCLVSEALPFKGNQGLVV